MRPKPWKFNVRYPNLDLYRELVEEQGTEDIDLIDYWEDRDFKTRSEAVTFAETVEGTANVVERINIRRDGLVWDWDWQDVGEF